MRHDSPLSPGGLPAGGRVLLQTEVVSAGQGAVSLTLPAGYPRFVIEADDFAPTANFTYVHVRFAIAGDFKTGGNDYEWTGRWDYADGTTGEDERDDDVMRISSAQNDLRMGNTIPGASYSFNMQIEPGSSTNFPKYWIMGNYFASEETNTGRLIQTRGAGTYKGETSAIMDRIDGVQFFFNTDTMDRGTFRLYGTE